MTSRLGQARLVQIAISGPVIDDSCKEFIHVHPGHIRAIERVEGTTVILFTIGQRSFPSTHEHHMSIVEQWRERLGG